MPIGNSEEQKLSVITKLKNSFKEEHYDEVAFVPMLPGKSLSGND
jgi:hypothetical protein